MRGFDPRNYTGFLTVTLVCLFILYGQIKLTVNY